MRLLKLETDSSSGPLRFPKDRVLPYAILSHTWEREEDEVVTFKDLEDGTGDHKEGF
jgi:hypothetical protein